MGENATVTDSPANRYVEAGLYDPDSPDAAEWLELLEHLSAQGATIEQMVTALGQGGLIALGADLTMYEFGGRITAEQAAERSGLTVERVQRLRLATGFPFEPGASLPGWLPEDLAGFDLGAAFFGEGAVLAFSRVMGASAARVADAALALFLNEIEAGLDANGASLVERARANEDASGLLDVVTSIMNHLVREHLELAVRRQRVAAEGWGRAALATAIGFVDLASSTEWATSIPLRAQADALARFESAAWDIATRRGGRIVKLIGDEAMFVTNDPVAACHIALEICEAVDAEPSLPRARGAVGFGEVAMRDGDYYGPLVHITARAVKAADEGAVVVTAGTRDRVTGGGLHFESIGAQALRGIEEPLPLFVVTAR